MNPYESPKTPGERRTYLSLRDLVVLVCLAEFLIGSLVWVFSRPVTGELEPWDVSVALYFCVIATCGIAPGLLGVRASFYSLLSCWLGQICGALWVYWPPHMGHLILGAVSTGVGSIPFLFGALIGLAIKLSLSLLKTESEKLGKPQRGKEQANRTHSSPNRT